MLLSSLPSLVVPSRTGCRRDAESLRLCLYLRRTFVCLLVRSRTSTFGLIADGVGVFQACRNTSIERLLGLFPATELSSVPMARVRKIEKQPRKTERNYFVADASFLVNKYLPIGTAPTADVEHQIREAHKWWKEIDRQVADQRARVYLPDLCIAEAFKALATKYYSSAFSSPTAYKNARDRLSNDVSMNHKELQAQVRYIGYHDVPASRDIIVAVGRFYELFMKHKCNVGIIDLILVSTAKYLMDFHDAPCKQIHIVTHDNAL